MNVSYLYPHRDKGTTALYGGSRIEKDHIRVEAYGTVDELISQLGVCYATTRDAGLRESLHHIQQTLFVLGLNWPAMRGPDPPEPDDRRRGDHRPGAAYRPQYGRERPVKTVRDPGRNLASAQLHVARTQSRRLERLLTAMDRAHPLRDALKRYSNRLSDALFSMARIEETRPDACA
ncbi:ATP:cob(I)alamin adenosyltransferase [Klebsiella pneumoniae]|nr:ATP:cob(I)alamin adenosyltransferase [Klebsiella pneumoniae]